MSIFNCAHAPSTPAPVTERLAECGANIIGGAGTRRDSAGEESGN